MPFEFVDTAQKREKPESRFVFVQQEPEESGRTFGEVAKDSVSALAVGASNLVADIGWLMERNPDPIYKTLSNPLGAKIRGLGERAAEYWEDNKSEKLRASLDELGAADGFIETVSAAKDNPEVVPDLLLGSIAYMLPGGVAGRGVGLAKGIKAGTTASMVTGGILEGAGSGREAEQQVSDMSFEELAASSDTYQHLVNDKGLTPEQAKEKIRKLTGLTAFAFTAPISMIASKLSGAARLETDFYTGTPVKKIVSGLIKEGSEETVQEGSNKLGSNIGNKLFADREQSLSEGVGNAAAIGAIAGGAQSTGMNAVSTLKSAIQADDQGNIEAPGIEDGSPDVQQAEFEAELERIKAKAIQAAENGASDTELATYADAYDNVMDEYEQWRKENDPTFIEPVSSESTPEVTVSGEPDISQNPQALNENKENSPPNTVMHDALLKAQEDAATDQHEAGVYQGTVKEQNSVPDPDTGLGDLDNNQGVVPDGSNAEGIVEPLAPGDLAAESTLADSENQVNQDAGTDIQSQIDQGAHEAATSPENSLPEPSEAQKEAGNYKKGKIRLHGLDIRIENPKGSVRSGTDPDGNAWETTMEQHYGYLTRSTGSDGDQVDVFVGQKPESEKVFVIDQVNADGSFDEHKVMISYDSERKAVAGYRSNYTHDWKVGPVTEMSIDQFKEWLKGDTTGPVSTGLPSAKAKSKGQEGPDKPSVYSLKTDEQSSVGLDRDIVQKEAQEFLSGLKLEHAIELNVYGTADELTQSLNVDPELARKAVAFMQGDVLHVIAGAMQTSDDARAVFRHEILAHYGLNTLPKAEKLDILKRIERSRTFPGIKEHWKEVSNTYTQYQNKPLKIAEEVFARIAESASSNKKGGIWKVIVEKVIAALRRVGLFKGTITRSEALAALQSIAEGIRQGKSTNQADSEGKFSLKKASKSDFAEENRKIREKDRTLWNKAKKVLRRQFAPGGLLPDSVFKEKIKRDSQFEVVEFDVRHLIGVLEKAVKKDYLKNFSQLSEEQRKHLSEALSGQMPGDLKEDTKVAITAMRRYLDHMSGEYINILENQKGEMEALLNDGEKVLLKAFQAMKQVPPPRSVISNNPEVKRGNSEIKGKTAKARESILEKAKSEAKGLLGEGQSLQSALTNVSEIAEKIALMETILSNQGQYVHRSYQVFDDPNWYKKVSDKVLDDARDYLKYRYLGEGESLSESNRRARRTIEKILKNGTAYDGMESFIHESNLGAKDLSVLQRRKEIAPEIRALLGEYTDPRLNFAKTATKMGRLIWNQRFLDRVKEMGVGSFLFEDHDAPPEATAQIAADGSEVYAPLNGLWTTPEIKQAFQDALGKEQLADWYKAVVQVNGLVKFGKTILSPTTATRNWQSAFFFTLASGHFDIRQMSKSITGLREYFTHAGSGEKLKYLRRLKELGVVYDTPLAGEMMRLLDDSQVESKLTGTDASLKAKAMLNFAQKFYQYGDDFWKIIGFENEKNMLMKHAGMSQEEAEIEAAERIRNTYPTYSMVGRGIKSLRRFPLAGTFVSFPAEIIRTSYHNIRYAAKDMKTPGMRPLAARRMVGITMVSGFTYALQALSKAMFDIDDEEEDAIRLLVAPWNKNSNVIFTNRIGSGKISLFDLSFLDPYNYWKRPINAIMRDRPWQEEAVSAIGETVSPFLGEDILFGAIREIASNKKSSGGEIYKETDSTGRQLYDIGGHLRKAVQPGLASNLERTWKALKGEVSGSGREYVLSDEGLAWIGWRATTLDTKIPLYYRSFEFSDAKSDATSVLNNVIRNPNQIDDKKLVSAYKRSLKMREKAYQEMIEVVAAVKRLGMTDEEITTTLRGSNTSKADIQALLAGEIPEWKPTSQSERYAVNRAKAIHDDNQAEEVKRRFQFVREIEPAASVE